MITRRHLLTATFTAMATTAITASCTKEPEPEPSTLATPSGGDDTSTTEADSAEEDPSFAPAPTDEASRASAGDHAVATLEAFWDTSTTQTQWYENLSALMTPTGGEPFQHTLIENVVPSAATGEPAVEFLDEGNTAEVTVQSEQGGWVLTLYRDGDGWLTESIRFPKEA